MPHLRIFKDLKRFPRGTCFLNNDEVKITVLDFIRNLDEKYCEEDLLEMIYRHDICLNAIM